MNIEERIKHDLHNFLFKVEEGRKEHSPAMNVEAYIIDVFAKQMATGVLLEISLHDKVLVEEIEKSKEKERRYENAYNPEAFNLGLDKAISLLKQEK